MLRQTLPIVSLAAGSTLVGSNAAAQSLDIVIDITDKSNSTITAVADQALVDLLSTGFGYNLINRLRFELSTSGQFTGGLVFGFPVCFECVDPFPTPDLVMVGATDSPPLGAYLNENPLELATFSFTGELTSFEVVGELAAAYDVGSFFPDLLTFQNADGSAGDVPFEVIIVPAPATAAVVGAALLTRRRR